MNDPEIDWRPGRTLTLRRDDDEDRDESEGIRWTYDDGNFYATVVFDRGQFWAHVSIDQPEDEEGLLTELKLFEQEGNGKGASSGEALDVAHREALSVQALNFEKVRERLEGQIAQPELDLNLLEEMIERLSSDKPMHAAALLEKLRPR